MYNYRVKSLPLKEVIRDLAEEFGTEVLSDCDKYWLQLPEQIGNGIIRGINFKEGLGYLEYNCVFHEETRISFTVDDIHPAKFLYCIKGELRHAFEHNDLQHHLHQYQNIIVASSRQNGHTLEFMAGKPTHIVSLEVDRAHFKEQVICSIQHRNDKLSLLFLDTEAAEKFLHEGTYSLRIADLVEEISMFQNKDLLEALFLKAKSYEILTYQVIQYNDDHRSVNNRSILRKSDIEKIKEAANAIKKNLNSSQTVEAIAAHIGMSITNVQNGFKILYKTTVNGYVKRERLKLAKELLLHSDLSISEIVFEIGLNSKSYFSKIFRAEYEISPSDFRAFQKKYDNEQLNDESD